MFSVPYMSCAGCKDQGLVETVFTLQELSSQTPTCHVHAFACHILPGLTLSLVAAFSSQNQGIPLNIKRCDDPATQA